jgi:hypothetical protein
MAVIAIIARTIIAGGAEFESRGNTFLGLLIHKIVCRRCCYSVPS